MTIHVGLIAPSLTDLLTLALIFQIFFTSIVTAENALLTISTRDIFHDRTSSNNTTT